MSISASDTECAFPCESQNDVPMGLRSVHTSFSFLTFPVKVQTGINGEGRD